MKKILLLSALAIACLAGWAQSSPESALPLAMGENPATVEDGAKAWWTFTADADIVLTLGGIGGCEVNVNDGQADEYGEYNNWTSVYVNDNYDKGYAVKAGQQVYIYAQGGTEIGVRASQEAANIGSGKTPESPIAIAMDKWNCAGDATYSGWDQLRDYFSYTATEDGVLVLSTPSAPSETVVGTKYMEWVYAGGGSTLSIAVEAGKTYTIEMSYYRVLMFRAEMTHPEPGSYAMPFEVAEGENAIPAAFGDYYYNYSNGKKLGFANIQFPDMPGAKVKVYADQWSYPDYPSFEGDATSVRFEMAYENQNYLIVLGKVDATEEAQSFTFTYEPYAEGEREENPIAIAELPATLTTPSAKGTYYYSVAVPADASQMLVAKAEAATNSMCTIYSGYSYGAATELGGSSVVAEGGKTYTIKWEVDEAEPLAFSVYFQAMGKGDAITDPLEAVLGENEVPGDGTKYYTYTTTKACKLNVEGTPDMTVEFPAGTGDYDGTLSCTHNGVNWYIAAEEGQQVYIKVGGCKAGDKFTLTEAEWQAGESAANPIDVEGDKFSFGDKQLANTWIRYTVKNDGILVVSSDMPYNYNCQVLLQGPDDDYASGMSETLPDYTSIYRATRLAKAGDEYLVNLQLDNIYPDYSISFTEREAENGESVDCAIEVKPSVATAMLAADNNLPRWYKFGVKPGTVHCDATAYIGGAIYKSIDDAKAGIGEDIEMEYVFDNTTYETTYFFELTPEAEGVWYMKMTNAYVGNTFTLSGDGSTTGISEVRTEKANRTNAIYNIAGQRVAVPARGLYIVGGRKVVVK